MNHSLTNYVLIYNNPLGTLFIMTGPERSDWAYLFNHYKLVVPLWHTKYGAEMAMKRLNMPGEYELRMISEDELEILKILAV